MDDECKINWCLHFLSKNLDHFEFLLCTYLFSRERQFLDIHINLLTVIQLNDDKKY